jgi:photosystem II stability/assembly factor-like uncharacterized protein
LPDFFVYCGLAGDTDPGRFWSAGLYRSRNGDGAWESIGDRLGTEPHVFSILADLRRRGRVTVGTHDGIWRSDDAGDSWRRLDAPRPELGVWSLAAHPAEPHTLFAGYEPCGIYRSMDDGKTWTALPVHVRYPAVSDRPEIPKRVISIAVDPSNPREIYASLEVGGLLRSLDEGASWENVIDGLYLDEGFVDIHAVVVNPKIPGQLTIATRFGVFRSDDRGAHWRDLKAPLLRPIGSYCRRLCYAPNDGNTLYLGAANDFDGDRGVLFITRDNGSSWEKTEPRVWLKTPIFGLAVDAKQPDGIFYASKIGQLVFSRDRGATWSVNPLKAGAGHVFSLAVG